ncbi:DNA cytosine methyltransferase [Microvirga lotononidis]|nr:DNA cytosine methyltransferase [Microvirga lotononidis]WQO29847.1 DNA cytosine methyltransferase [Microvirga lotononidis]
MNRTRGRAKSRPRGSVVDLFCGAGGLTHGFRLEGFMVAAGVDVDEDCRYAFEHNNSAPFIRKDVTSLRASELRELFYKGEPTILVGCAPCQPFSTYNQKNDDPKWRLVERFGNLIVKTLPDVVSMENVPRLLDFQDGKVFKKFVRKLTNAGYFVYHDVVFLPDYGLPQRRSRLVLLASRHGEIELEEPQVEPDEYVTVEETIGGLPKLTAGASDPNDPLHSASRMSDLNLRRIRASRPGGTWLDWDEELVASCHKVATGRGYMSVYGRMRADEPSPTITTQFFGFGNGRFGHPIQDRALSLREGAMLQSFPKSYAFLPPGKRIEFKKLGRMIGNAVPVLLGQVIARSIRNHIELHDL